MAANFFNVAVTTSATLLASSGEGVVAIYNNGTGTIYLGFDATVTSSNGYPLAATGQISIASSTFSQSIYAISASGTQDVRVLLGSL